MELDVQQNASIAHDGGVDIVIASAGSGKTRTLCAKVERLIAHAGFSPRDILLLTFSRKAALEIRERVASVLPRARDIYASTFHSYCYDFLRRSGAVPVLLEDAARETLLDGCIRKHLASLAGLPLSTVRMLLESQERLAPERMRVLEEIGIIRVLSQIRADYADTKRRQGVMDYDDLITRTISALESGAAEAWRYVLVDEFQDSSADDLRLVRLLMRQSGNLFAVGDDWQSIYAFRGARPEALIAPGAVFPGARVHCVGTNYRSRAEIVSAAERVISCNRFRSRKTTRSFRGRGGRVEILRYDSEETSDAHIARIVREYGAVTVLYRDNWMGQELERRLPPEIVSMCRFMTMHASKGLEFDSVIIAGMERGIMPAAEASLEEERRLLYVAMTRARELLWILAASGKRESALFPELIPRFSPRRISRHLRL